MIESNTVVASLTPRRVLQSSKKLLSAVALLVVVGGLLELSCGGADCQNPQNAQSVQCVVENAVIDCTGVSSLSTAVAVVEPIVQNLITSAIQADGSVAWASIETQLVALGFKYGGCVLAEIWDYYIHGILPGSGSGSGSGSGVGSGSGTLAPKNFLARVKISPLEFTAEFGRLRARFAPGQSFKTTFGTTL